MKEKSHLYYSVRSVVRVTFWSTVTAGLLFGAILISQLGDKPACNVHMNFDFTWNAEEFESLNKGLTLSQCEHPDLAVLKSDGTWDWVQER